MEQKLFGSEITRTIWSSSENIVLIYVGSAADFALNPENHWLFYTMRLPENPQKRFIETFSFNQKIIFTPLEKIPELAKTIREIHKKLEEKRSAEESSTQRISNTAFMEVNDMLIDYGIRGYEYLHHKKMTDEQKELYYQDMKNFVSLMGVTNSPESYLEWFDYREESIKNRLAVNEYTDELFSSYKKDIGNIRYELLLEFMAFFVHPEIAKKLGLKKHRMFSPFYRTYQLFHSKYSWKLALKLLFKPETRKVLTQLDSISNHLPK